MSTRGRPFCWESGLGDVLEHVTRTVLPRIWSWRRADDGGRMAGSHAVGFPSSRCGGMAQGPSRGQGVAGLVPGFPPHLGPFRARPTPCFPRIPNVAAYLMGIRPRPYHKRSHITRPKGEGVHTLMVPGCRPEPAIGGDARSVPGMTGRPGWREGAGHDGEPLRGDPSLRSG